MAKKSKQEEIKKENIEECADSTESTCKCHDNHCECSCHEDKECDCGCEHDCNSQAEEYLAIARQVQADFENFRRHALEDIKLARLAGQASVIEVFLPCLDTFKEAKKAITDEAVLQGVNMIEDKIMTALNSLGVEKISTVGEVYNPHKHECLAVARDESKENNIILDEYQAGYTFNGKVIKYAKVIVNKKED